jgi:hypothetical protein
VICPCRSLRRLQRWGDEGARGRRVAEFADGTEFRIDARPMDGVAALALGGGMTVNEGSSLIFARSRKGESIGVRIIP